MMLSITRCARPLAHIALLMTLLSISAFVGIATLRTAIATPAAASGSTVGWTEQKVSASDGATDDDFGYAVSVSGTTAVVGVPYAAFGSNAGQGVAYAYTQADGIWTEQQELSADDGVADDGFGFSVSVSGDTLLIGAPYATVGGNAGEGAAYVFTRSNGVWTQVGKLSPDDGDASFNFGWSVALSGLTALVSAPVAPVGDNALQGKAYVFDATTGDWTQTQTLVADDGSAFATFGSSVALDGTTAVVGAAGVNSYLGAAYVFDGSGASWAQTAELVPDDGVMTEFFGLAVAVSGSTALVGAYNQRVGSNNSQGSAYVYAASAGVWSQQQKLTASDGAASARFGLSVALDGATALIGSYFAAVDGHAQQGAAYVFTQAGDSWSEVDKLVASDGVAHDHFGNAVALSGPAALVGAFDVTIDGHASQGAAYFFTQAIDDTIFANGFDGAP
ncbi:MAG: FG-GAP repeat protein [Dokdonella sp.]